GPAAAGGEVGDAPGDLDVAAGAPEEVLVQRPDEGLLGADGAGDHERAGDALGRLERLVRVDDRAVGLVDLGVQVGAVVLGVARVAGVGDELAGLDGRAPLDAGAEDPLLRVGAVVGAGGVVVDVDVPVLPALGVAQHHVVALGAIR